MADIVRERKCLGPTDSPSREDLDLQGQEKLSVVIPVLNEAENLALLIPRLKEVLCQLGSPSEIVVVDGGSADDSRNVAREHDARIVEQESSGYGGALLAGFASAKGSHILTLDADLSHTPDFIPRMWERRHEASIVIASRYVSDGAADMPLYRLFLSRVLNVIFRRIVSLPFYDLSSGFRLYKAADLKSLSLTSSDFDINQETLIKIFAEGRKVVEVPFAYRPRGSGRSKVRLAKFALSYLRTLVRMWALRNSIASADYDDRAFDSVIWLQRYWQRARFRHTTGLCLGPTLDVGCGSSRIIGSLPPGSIALDLQLRKLRYARKFGMPLVQANAFTLPFASDSFASVLCSQVIEHVPKDSPILDELCRVLQPGGRLVLGTPDYSRWQWRWIERLYSIAAPGAYADEHIAHYSLQELEALFNARGFVTESVRYIAGAELILALCKPASTSSTSLSHPPV